MQKCIVIPDSFKGTLQAKEICDIIEKKIWEFYPECKVKKIPVSDGGEGTVDCFLSILEAEKIEIFVHNAYMEMIPVYYARRGNTAIIEMAQAAGLPQVESRKNPLLTTTYGVGEMILHAVENGCNDLIIGLGGSCTNDCGCGMATALGACFKRKNGERFIPTGGNLKEICSIDITDLRKRLQEVNIRAMCDIDNPLCGDKGASVIFGPQKGADEEDVRKLEDNMKCLGKYLEQFFKCKIMNIPGAGAAGGMGAGIKVFMQGQLMSGIDLVLDLVNFDTELEDTDLVITGEGKIDSQSLEGKAVIGISKRAEKKKVPVVAIVGSIGKGAEKAYAMGVSSMFSINRQAQDFKISQYFSKENLEATVGDILRFYKAVK